MGRQVARVVSRVWHRMRGYQWEPASEFTPGSMDDTCTCFMCLRRR